MVFEDNVITQIAEMVTANAQNILLRTSEVQKSFLLVERPA